MGRLACIPVAVLALEACGGPQKVVEPAPIPPRGKAWAAATDPQTDQKLATRDVIPPEEQASVHETPEPKATSPGVVERAPAGALVADDGSTIDLQKATADHGAVLVFYRGHWCEACKKQLVELEKARPELEGRGVHIYAVSTEPPEMASRLRQNLGLEFPLLSDPTGAVTARWNVYTPEQNLARPSVFVIAPGGYVTYQYVATSPGDRPPMKTIIEKVKQLEVPE